MKRKRRLHASPKAPPNEGAAFNHRDGSVSFCAAGFEGTNFSAALAGFYRLRSGESVFDWNTIKIVPQGQIPPVIRNEARIKESIPRFLSVSIIS